MVTMQPFKEATLLVSTNKHPRIFEVIPIIDLLTKFLEDAVKQVDVDVFIHEQDRKAVARSHAPGAQNTRPHFDVVRAAALAGLGMLDKYYAKTDESIMYRVAMCMFHSTSHALCCI